MLQNPAGAIPGIDFNIRGTCLKIEFSFRAVFRWCFAQKQLLQWMINTRTGLRLVGGNGPLCAMIDL